MRHSAHPLRRASAPSCFFRREEPYAGDKALFPSVCLRPPSPQALPPFLSLRPSLCRPSPPPFHARASARPPPPCPSLCHPPSPSPCLTTSSASPTRPDLPYRFRRRYPAPRRPFPHQIQVHRVAVLLHELGGGEQQRRVVPAELHDQGPVLGVGVEVALSVRPARSAVHGFRDEEGGWDGCVRVGRRGAIIHKRAGKDGERTWQQQ